MKLYIAGHRGLVGSALVQQLQGRREIQLILAPHEELDLSQQEEVEAFFRKTRPDTVILAAGRVGGIQANFRFPAEFIYQNLMIEANVIHASWENGVRDLINFGSSCIYPKDCPQPMTPDRLMTGRIEETNEPYGIAKLSGLALCEAYNRQYGTRFVNIIPANLYGPGDNFDLARAHVVASLLRKFHEARAAGEREIALWGSGRVGRDFLYVNDLAEALVLLLDNLDQREDSGVINVGSGKATTIRELASEVQEVTRFQGEVRWDASRPDGAPDRLLDTQPIQKLGWKPRTGLKEGLEQTYHWFLENRCIFS